MPLHTVFSFVYPAKRCFVCVRLSSQVWVFCRATGRIGIGSTQSDETGSQANVKPTMGRSQMLAFNGLVPLLHGVELSRCASSSAHDVAWEMPADIFSFMNNLKREVHDLGGKLGGKIAGTHAAGEALASAATAAEKASPQTLEQTMHMRAWVLTQEDKQRVSRRGDFVFS